MPRSVRGGFDGAKSDGGSVAGVVAVDRVAHGPTDGVADDVGQRAVDVLDRDDHDDELTAAEQAHAERRRMPNRGAVVFRARPKWTVPGLIVGGLVGALIASGGGMLLGAGIGALVGSRLRRSVCSGPRCGAPLDADATQCSKCGGTVVGVIERTKDHLGALEDYEERQLALEAEP